MCVGYAVENTYILVVDIEFIISLYKNSNGYIASTGRTHVRLTFLYRYSGTIINVSYAYARIPAACI